MPGLGDPSSLEYARYMLTLAPNDMPEKQRQYWKERVASIEGHEKATKKSMAEIAKSLYPTMKK